jgi:hypothetical protein
LFFLIRSVCTGGPHLLWAFSNLQPKHTERSLSRNKATCSLALQLQVQPCRDSV